MWVKGHEATLLKKQRETVRVASSKKESNYKSNGILDDLKLLRSE